MASLLNSLVSLLFPIDCKYCGIPFENTLTETFCERCIAKVEVLSEPLCTRCGKGFPKDAFGHEPKSHLCGDCLTLGPVQKTRTFAFARTYGPYKDVMRRLLIEFKFHGDLCAGKHIYDFLWKGFCREDAFERAGIITHVPLHWRRYKERNFNQSSFLAKRLARELGLPRKRLLWRNRATRPQVGLNLKERKVNVRRAFKPTLASRHAIGKTVLLIDDVMTTGATLQACSEVLLKAGAKEVMVLTAARASGMESQ